MTPFEYKIMSTLCSNDIDAKMLENQLSEIAVKNRDYTGVGLYTEFSVSDTASLLPEDKNRMIDNPALYLSHPELENGAGVILWLEGRKISTLECFVYDGNWPNDESLFEIHT